MKEIEIEFKNLLTEEEYDKIYNFYNLKNNVVINNANYYYETCSKDLKNNSMALRIRHSNNKQEITLKIKGEKENKEYNVTLDNKNIPQVLNINDLPREIVVELEKINIKEKLNLIQKIVTERKEVELEKGLLVLDKTYFLGNIIDYELEFEACDYEDGKLFFENLLKQLSIEKKEAQPKIARAVNYSNK